MKKLIMSFAMFIILTGCTFSITDVDNTPTKKVEAYLNNYQSLTKDVLSDLDLVVEKEETFTDEQKDKYKDVMKNNFQDLTYVIKEETVNGDAATVEVEINVTDFYKVNKASDSYLVEHEEDFKDESGNYDENKFIDYKLEQMSNTNDKVKYTIYFNVTKNDDGKWELEDIDEFDEEKILGLYEY